MLLQLGTMAERIDGELLLADEVGQALVGDVDPQRLESFRFAVPIMPAFRLVRALTPVSS